MFVRHLLPFAAFGLAAICGPLLETAGEAGGGGAPAGGGAPPATPTTDRVSADPAPDPANAADAGAEGHEPPDLDDDATGDARDEEEFVSRLPEANLRTRVRRSQRYRRDTEPIVSLFRGPDGKYMPPQEVTRLLANAREFEQLDRVLKADPRAVQALMDAEARLRNGGSAAADEPPAFDEAAFEQAWPYEVESKEGRAFFERQKADAKRTHGLEDQVRRLERLVTGVQQTTAQQTFEQIEGRWKAVAFKACEEVDPLYREMFLGNVKAQFDLLRGNNQLTKVNAQAVVDRLLANVRAAKKTQTRTTTARQSAMAAGNATLPRTPRPGTVQPASGEPAPKRETIADSHKSWLARYRR